MLTKKQIRLLQLLEEQILDCKRCALHGGGRCKPYWTTRSRYVIVGEAPGKNEVVENTPFTGMAGRILWDTIYKVLRHLRSDFAIINSVNCRPTDGMRNLKPTKEEQISCQQWIRKFINVIEPEKVLILGNYAMGTMLGKYSGIAALSGANGYLREYKNTPFVVSVHPAYALYNKDEGIKKLNVAMEKFKEVNKPVQFDLFDDSLFQI